jgi:hypothetical protein
VGNHSITATYRGDGNFTTSASPPLAVVVKQQSAICTTTTVTSSAVTSEFGHSITFTAKVTANAVGATAPSGTVQFQVDGRNYGSPVLLVNGQASFSTSGLSLGDHTILAVYSGGPSLLPSTGKVHHLVLPSACHSGQPSRDFDDDWLKLPETKGVGEPLTSPTGAGDSHNVVGLVQKIYSDILSLLTILRPESGPTRKT